MKLTGKVVVVTGGGSGIGRELVLAALKRGARVAAVDLRREGLDETASLAAAGDALSLHVADITDREAILALPDAVIAHHGAVDGVINNAGVIQPFVRFNDLDFAVIDRMIQVNLYGTLHVLKAFLPHLLARPEAHVANVSSMGGFLPVPGQTMYGAAKAAVKLLTEGLFAELLDTKVGVSVILPGAVGTNIAANSGVQIAGMDEADAGPLKPLPPPDAARIILDGIEAGRLHILVGNDSKLMFLASRVAPKRATALVARQLQGLLSS
ncbi:MAG: SDR family oxidoreductase [Alphaproteobacteria bacterium]|nr:SDR family oxidoreductase [Alphaproteobacteria bacterium]